MPVLSDRERRIITQLRIDIFADQESSRLPARQQQAQVLHESLYLHFIFEDVTHHGAE